MHPGSLAHAMLARRQLRYLPWRYLVLLALLLAAPLADAAQQPVRRLLGAAAAAAADGGAGGQAARAISTAAPLGGSTAQEPAMPEWAQLMPLDKTIRRQAHPVHLGPPEAARCCGLLRAHALVSGHPPAKLPCPCRHRLQGNVQAQHQGGAGGQ